MIGQLANRPVSELNEAIRDIAKNDYGIYVEFVHQGLYQHGRHTRYICERLEAVERGECKRLILTLPPRHSKSMSVSETFPSWYLGRNPNKRVIEVSYGDNLAKRFGRENKKKIELFGKDIFGIELSRHNASNNHFDLEGYRGGMISAGIGSSITGFGSDLLILDDVIKNRKEALSKTYKDTIWNEWKNTLLTRLQPNGAIIIILTRWSEDDLVGRILEEEGDKWEIINLPAEAMEDDLLGREVGEPLWPDIGFDEDWIKERKREVGQQVWWALYQQSPRPTTGNLVKRDYFNYYERLPVMDEIIQSWDCAFKDEKTSDYVVGTVWGRKGANYYLIDLVRDRMGIVATMDAIRNMSAKYPKARTKLIEDKANGTAVIEMLKKEISGIVPYSPKESKVARLQAVVPLFEAGNIYIPGSKMATWVHDYVEEMISFPVGKNDDQVDSTTMALLRLESGQQRLFIGRA